MPKRTIPFVLAALVALSIPVNADAQWLRNGADAETMQGDYPNTFTERPITLPKLTLRVTGGVDVLRVDLGGPDDPTYTVSLGGGVAFGIVDEFELGLGATPIANVIVSGGDISGLAGVVSPSDQTGFLPPYAYGRVRFFHASAFEMGLEVGFMAPVDGTDPQLVAVVPMRLRGGQAFAIDFSVGTMFDFGENASGGRDVSASLVGLVAPRFAAPAFYAGVDFGLVMPFEDPDQTLMPFFMEFGVTVDPGRHIFDIFGRGGFPAFLAPGSDGDKVITEIFEFTSGVRFYFDLDR